METRRKKVAADTETPAAAANPLPTADPQDPLPESNWFWRRIFVGVICATLLFLVWWYADAIAKVALQDGKGVVESVLGLVSLLKLALYLLGMVIMLYLIAPSAEQAGKWLATISAWKGGVSTSSQSRAVGPDGSTAEASTSAGPARTAPPVAPTKPVKPEVDLAP
jgi:hypothetical protein